MPIIEWIPVEWNTPDTPNECTTSGTNVSATVMVCGDDASGLSGGIGFGHYQDDGKWVCYEGEYDFMHVQKVTHWARMPALPSNVAGNLPARQGRSS